MVERSLSSFEGHVVFAGEGSSILPWGLFVMRPISILALYSLRGSVSLVCFIFVGPSAECDISGGSFEISS